MYDIISIYTIPYDIIIISKNIIIYIYIYYIIIFQLISYRLRFAGGNKF